MMRTLGLIPARGGSKGIPRKNIRSVAGKPLLAYTAEAALAARRLSRVVLSTDDEEIAALGKACGVEAPFLRPAGLAGDAAPMLPVVQHAVRWLEDHGDRFDAVCLLQPTNPLRRPEHIDACIDLLAASGADSVITVLAVPPEHNPHWVYFPNPDGSLRLSTGEVNPIPRRQDLPPAFHRDGSVYVTSCRVLMRENSLYGRRVLGYLLDAAASANIDSPEDLERAARLLSSKKGASGPAGLFSRAG
jgi:CMP-N,N'-diacetyllegionaminic acid synthase